MVVNAPDGGLYPSPELFPGPDVFPSDPTVADRYRGAVGTDTRAELGFYIGAMSITVMLTNTVAGMAQQPRDWWTLAGLAIGYAWGRRAWRATAK